jgi:hypothetical protein
MAICCKAMSRINVRIIFEVEIFFNDPQPQELLKNFSISIRIVFNSNTVEIQ